MEKLGSPCNLLAIQGRTLLRAGKIKRFDSFIFPGDVAPIHGVGYKDGVAILEQYLGLLDRTTPHEDWPVNLQLMLAHEIEHSLKGAEHQDRAPGQWWPPTENDWRCSGLS